MFQSLGFLLLLLSPALQAAEQLNTECFSEALASLKTEIKQFLQAEIKQFLQDEMTQLSQIQENISNLTNSIIRTEEPTLNGSISLDPASGWMEMIDNKIISMQDNITSDMKELTSSQSTIMADLRDLASSQSIIQADQAAMEKNLIRSLNASIDIQTHHMETAVEFYSNRNDENLDLMGREVKLAQAQGYHLIELVGSLSANTLLDGNATAATLDEMTTNLTRYRRETVQLKAELGKTNNAQAAMTTRLAQLKAELGRKAYFTAVGYKEESYSTSGATIKFPTTRVNVVPAGFSGGWNNRTSQYMCPLDGDYLFIVTLYKRDSMSISSIFDFMKTGYNCAAQLVLTPRYGTRTILTTLHNKHDDSDVTFTSTMQTITHCRSGDRVSVITGSSSCKLFDDSNRMNHFSGLLLRQRA